MGSGQSKVRIKVKEVKEDGIESTEEEDWAACEEALEHDPRHKLVSFQLTEDDDLGVKMETILISKTERKIFTIFLQEELSGEIIQFFKACEEYQSQACKFAALKRHGAGSQDERLHEIKIQHPHIVKMAKTVFDHFISPAAPQAVTLSDRMIRKIQTEIKSGSVTTELFFTAIKEVKRCMALDKLPRFSTWVQSEGALQTIFQNCDIDDQGYFVKRDGESTILEGIESYQGSDLLHESSSQRKLSNAGSAVSSHLGSSSDLLNESLTRSE